MSVTELRSGTADPFLQVVHHPINETAPRDPAPVRRPGPLGPPRSGERPLPTTTGVDRASQAYRKLRELIVHGRMAPGARVIETEVADKLGLSRTPVRAALQRLQQEGYIRSRGKGVRARPVVSPMTWEDARDLFEIVGEIEALGARRSAELPLTERDRLVGVLQGLNDDLQRLGRAERPDRNALFDRDTEFHHEYVYAAAGPRLRSLHDAVKPQAERYVRLHIHGFVNEILTSVNEHQDIVDAIAQGSAGRAQRAVQVNWRNAAGRLKRVIDEMGERGSW